MDITETPKEYKDYRNYKFQSFVNRMCELFSAVTVVVAFTAIRVKIGTLTALLFMFFYMLLSGMRKNMIYFFSNKNLGADWVDTLMRDTARAIRYLLAIVGGDVVLEFILKMLSKF